MRILILSSSTGGGHDMRASSLVSWLSDFATDIDGMKVSRYQGLEETSNVYKFGVSIYNWIQKNWPLLHHIYFNYLEIFPISRSKRLFIGRKHFEAVLMSEKPDLIISVHAHLNHVFREIAQSCLLSVKFVTYCGEMHGGYGFSRHWVDKGADLFIGATTEICESARRMGMPTEKTFHGGFMLKPSFYGPKLDASQQATYLQELNLRPDTFTLLLSTGANGAQNHKPLLQAIAQANLPIQIIALCSRNKKARKELEDWAHTIPGLEVRLLGHVDNMFPLMQACDCMLARPGTGTTSEAIMANCPVLFNAMGGIMPQEWITVKYCRARQLPANLIKKPKDLVSSLEEILKKQHSEIAAIQHAMNQLIPEPTPNDIIERLFQLCELPVPH